MTNLKERSTGDIIREAGYLSCPVQRAAHAINAFLKELMCGKCFPCALGAYEAGNILHDISSGKITRADIDALRRIADAMSVASRCKKGRDMALFINETLGENAFRDHIQGRCPDRACTSYAEYRVLPERCTMCGDCLKVCAYAAITGEVRVPYLSGYLPFEIVSRRCTGCGECLKACPNDAITVTDRIVSVQEIEK